MKTTITLLFALLLATSALAIIDPAPDHMGLYFDTDANVYCQDGVPPYSQVELYLLMTNPTFEAIYGFEAGLSFEGNALVLGTDFANPQALNVGDDMNMIVGFGSPTISEPATLLATITVMNMDTNMDAIFFDLHGSVPSSIDPLYPVVLLADGVLQLIETSGGPGPEAQINFCGSPVEKASLEQIKSLYR